MDVIEERHPATRCMRSGMYSKKVKAEENASLTRSPVLVSIRRCRCATSAGFSPLGPSLLPSTPPPFDLSSTVPSPPLPSLFSLPRATLGWHNRGRDQGGQIESGGGREERGRGRRRIRAEGGREAWAGGKKSEERAGSGAAAATSHKQDFFQACFFVRPSILLQGHPYVT